MLTNDVAGKELAGGLGLLAALDLGDALGRNEHVVDVVAHLLGLDALGDVFVDLVFLAGEDLDDKPLILGGIRRAHRGNRVGRHLMLMRKLTTV